MIARPQPWRSSASEIAATLGRDIVSGRFGPGAVLPREPELTARFGASRNTVREAMRLLSGKGLISISPRRGTRVRPQETWNLLDQDVLAWSAIELQDDPAFMRDLVRIRWIVEPAAAQMAAAQATDGDIAELRRAYAAMTAAETCDEIVRADVAFHEILLKCARNRFLQALARPVATVLRANFEVAVRRPGAYRNNLGIHGELVDAIAARDPARALDACHRMLSNNRSDIEFMTGSPGSEATSGEPEAPPQPLGRT